MEPVNLPELIAGCRTGDRKAQEQIFRTYHSDFLKVCLRFAADRSMADIMLNDAFFRIFTRIEQYKGEGSFHGWMRAIVVNTCLSELRKSDRHKEVQLPGQDDGFNEHHTPHSYNDAMSRIGMNELIRLIQCLPATTRMVFNLFIFEGFSHREIAEQLGMSEGTSHWHVSNARNWLKAKIIKEQQNAGKPI